MFLENAKTGGTVFANDVPILEKWRGNR